MSAVIESTEMAKAAAKWWRQQLESPKFDNGDQSNGGGLVLMMAIMNAAHNEPEDAQLDKFEQVLFQHIMSKTPRYLDVDYGPGMILGEAADASGVSTARFPWKTVMWLDYENNTLNARCGYGAPTVSIFPADEQGKGGGA